MPVDPDPDLALRLAKTVADLYGDATATLLRQVTRRLARGIEEPGWAERKLAELAALRAEALAELDRLSNATPEAVDDTLARAARAGERQAAADLAALDLQARTVARTNPAVVRTLAEETVGLLRAARPLVLRRVLDGYREVVADSAGQVTTGALTRRRAAQRALDRFAARGITGFIDRAGRNWELESYAEMATRTASGRVQVGAALDRFQAAGRDLVIVSDAPEECSICRRWEGKVLSSSGSTPGYPTVAEATGAGLFHASCRHRLGLYVPGLTEPLRGTSDPEGDRERQQQRYLERGVRRWKRAEAVALDPAAARRARGHRRQWQERLGAHVDEHDRKRLRYREQIGSAR